MDHSERPIAFLSLAVKYLGMSELAAREIERAHTLKRSPKRDKATWSVMLHGTPTLFTFFHGAELLMKGFVLAASDEALRGHGLRDALGRFEKSVGSSDNRIGELLEPYISAIPATSFLGRVLAANCTDIDRWYDLLRYPEPTKGDAFDHWDLRQESQETRSFWQRLSEDARALQSEAVELARSRGWYA